MTSQRLRTAWNKTEIKYYPIPVGIGIAVIVFQTLHHKYKEHEAIKNKDQAVTDQVIKRTTSGPWQVHVLDTIPLRALSRLWGKFNNDYNLPVWMREPFYKFYSWLFNCNLDEIENSDLKTYPNLGSFFYRSLKPGLRQIDEAILVSPADGRILSFGLVNDEKVEQIKGNSYSLSALLGHNNTNNFSELETVNVTKTSNIVDEKEFANINGITYSLDSLLGDESEMVTKQESSIEIDITKFDEHKKKEQVISKDVTKISPNNLHKWHVIKSGNGLFFCVIYLAPGDYHRFHSPTNWVVESRRHFAGELFSVSPYMLKLLPELFVLNERVALLGRWRYGFFAMIPVGATNVGSIKINFDPVLRTNQKEGLAVGTYTEMSYKNASKLLGGQPLSIGEEIGGFRMGSTIVLIFEAPLNFKFCVSPEQKINFGRKLGQNDI
ncbi:9374_t:CDS:2 [Scutellospora calospora]|uniref:9374_t:CDS:1 n=1 Tax=Scutellospora calospora TaxID=85575 RepID=A0ACA9KSF2_9GLOM|nr:9374_t:CDS:2 [Scutellospora calospora]